jgi:hypothetical protein
MPIGSRRLFTQPLIPTCVHPYNSQTVPCRSGLLAPSGQYNRLTERKMLLQFELDRTATLPLRACLASAPLLHT